MRPRPRYDGPPVIDVAGMGFSPLPVIRQRDRLLDVFSRLSADEWATQSRCEEWSVQDVAEHLVGVNQFFVASITGALRGEPTRLLARFDPVAAPAAMVAGARGDAPEATLEKLSASNEALSALLTSASESDLEKVAEAPPGHIAISAVMAHALWDAWVHERDVLLPLGREQEIEPDEVTMALAYVAAIGPACYVNSGSALSGSLAVRADNPRTEFVVQVSQQVTVSPGDVTHATATIEGSAVDLVEGLSCRVPPPDMGEDHRWLIDALSKLFAPHHDGARRGSPRRARR